MASVCRTESSSHQKFRRTLSFLSIWQIVVIWNQCGTLKVLGMQLDFQDCWESSLKWDEDAFCSMEPPLNHRPCSLSAPHGFIPLTPLQPSYSPRCPDLCGLDIWQHAGVADCKIKSPLLSVFVAAIAPLYCAEEQKKMEFSFDRSQQLVKKIKNK